MGRLIAGASNRGEFEGRLIDLIDEVKNSNGLVILFIDELHTLIGAGAGGQALDAANILKPALARGELQVLPVILCLAVCRPRFERNIDYLSLTLSFYASVRRSYNAGRIQEVY